VPGPGRRRSSLILRDRLVVTRRRVGLLEKETRDERGGGSRGENMRGFVGAWRALANGGLAIDAEALVEPRLRRRPGGSLGGATRAGLASRVVSVLYGGYAAGTTPDGGRCRRGRGAPARLSIELRRGLGDACGSAFCLVRVPEDVAEAAAQVGPSGSSDSEAADRARGPRL